MAKKVRLAALACALALLLSGCGSRPTGEAPDAIAMPEPSSEPERMILGERLPARLTNVSLYYPMADGAGFSTVALGVREDDGKSLVEAAVNALLSPTAGNTARVAPADTRLLSCEYACGIATVNLSLDARNTQGEQALMALTAAIGNTLLGIDGVQGVNVLIGGQSERFGRLPAGVQTEVVPSVTAAYAQILAEGDRLSTEGSLPVTRAATLYFPTDEGSWLVPELREVTLQSDDFTGALLDALKDGPENEACAVASIPAGVELLEGASGIETLSSGERVLTLSFSANLANYLVFSGLEEWELVGSVALTVCSFLPELDAVRIRVGDELISKCALGDTTITFEDGLIRRQDFASRVGSVATLYLAAQDGTLQALRRAVSMRSALSPRSLISELFDYAGSTGALSFPVPETVYASDILGIQVDGKIARVNLSGNFYRSCQLLKAEAERALIYCVVNTLCGLDEISAVRFYVEGVSADSLAGAVYLKRPLMANPGIIVMPEETGEP